MSSHRPTRPRTAWDAADWYIGMSGAHGHRYHRDLALPALLELLGARPGERVLDLGCGPGFPARPLARLGARYTGLDASLRMIGRARELHGALGEFLVGDARRPRAALGARPPFDAACFLFSLQDMDDLERVLLETGRLLRPGGRLVAVLTHPCFRVPRQSGWGWDAGRGLRYRRVDRYLTPLRVPSGPPGARTLSLHRPLQNYVGALSRAGFLLDALRELAPPTGRGQPEGNPDIPALLALRARR